MKEIFKQSREFIKKGKKKHDLCMKWGSQQSGLKYNWTFVNSEHKNNTYEE